MKTVKNLCIVALALIGIAIVAAFLGNIPGWGPYTFPLAALSFIAALILLVAAGIFWATSKIALTGAANWAQSFMDALMFAIVGAILIPLGHFVPVIELGGYALLVVAVVFVIIGLFQLLAKQK